MKKTLRTLIAATLLAATALPALAAPVLDQLNSGDNSPFCLLGTGQSCGQSFRQSGDNIAGAGLFIHPDFAAAPGTLTLSIYAAYAGGLGDLVASGSASGVGSDSGWVDVFWSPVALTAGATYYLVASSSEEGLAAAYTWDAGYAAGNALLDLQAVGYYADYDLAFRTFAQASAVPEPGTLALLGAGLGALLLGRRARGVARKEQRR